METFTASNGVGIERGCEYWMVIPKDALGYNISDKSMDALREFFQYERDQELGRWRWLGDQKWVVYKGSSYLVINEDRGTATYLPIAGWSDIGTDPAHRAVLAAYEAAHPVPKPWHDAKDGELWVLRFSDFPATDVSTLVKEGVFIYNDSCCDGYAPLDFDEIVNARRIWPEENNA